MSISMVIPMKDNNADIGNDNVCDDEASTLLMMKVKHEKND